MDWPARLAACGDAQLGLFKKLCKAAHLGELLGKAAELDAPPSRRAVGEGGGRKSLSESPATFYPQASHERRRRP